MLYEVITQDGLRDDQHEKHRERQIIDQSEYALLAGGDADVAAMLGSLDRERVLGLLEPVADGAAQDVITSYSIHYTKLYD